jgi:hypothetical protein
MPRSEPMIRARRRRALAVVAAFALAGVGGGGALGGCSGMSPPPATPLDASRANVALADLENGRSLLMRKCGSCHRPPMPSAQGRDEWPSKVDEMSRRSNLDTQQRQLIQAYLVTMATR